MYNNTRKRSRSESSETHLHKLGDQVSVLVHSKRDESFLALEGDTGLWLPSGEVLFRQTWQNAAAKCVQPYFARPIQVNRFIRLNRIWSSNLKHFISHAIFIVDVVREVKEAVKLINGAKWVSLEALIGENTNNPSLRTSKLLEIVRHYEDLKEETFNSGKFPYFGTILHEIGPLDEEDGSVSAKELLQAQLLGQSGSKEKSTQSEQGNGEGTEMVEYELATHSVRVKSSGTITDVSTLFGLEDEAAVTQSALKATEETGEAGLEKTIPRGSFDPSAQGNQMLTALRYFREATEDKPTYSWGNADMTNLGKYVVSLCRNVTEIFAKEPRLVRLSAPTYIFGDFHGNYKDLAYFEKALWKLGPILTPASFLFLGDYVDRGPHGVEVVTDLFAQKLLCPDKVILLRGNHETRRTQLRHGFKAECLTKFGNLGDVVWEAINNTFDCLPLTAIVDDKIFCAHGGIAPPDVGGLSLEEYEKIPVPLPEPGQESKLAWEVMWCDPADEGDVEEKKKELKENEGFAVNEKRNTGHLFSPEALEQFLAKNKLSYVVRAHEEKQAGFQVEQHAKLLTVFSSSNYGGRNNEAACILVDHGKLRVIRIDSP